jgi:hypothetical protein
LLDEPTIHPDIQGLPQYAYSLADRFRGPTLEDNPPGEPWDELGASQRRHDRRPNLILFGAHRRHVETNEVVPEDIFPHALRITVDLYDKGRRLDRPIRHVMVVSVGG